MSSIRSPQPGPVSLFSLHPEGQGGLVPVSWQCDLPSVENGIQLGWCLLSFNLFPVTDGTQQGKEKMNSLKTKKLVSFIWFQCSQHQGYLAVGAELEPFSISLAFIVAAREKKKIHHSRRAIQSLVYNRNLSETLFVLFYRTQEPYTSIKTEDCSDTRMLAYIHAFYYSQTYICTSTHSHTPLRTGDNCLAPNAPTIVRLPGRKEPGNKEGEGEESRLWVAPQSGYKGN